MEDTTAPVLLGLNLPTTVDLANERSILVRAQARDAGGAGLSHVEVVLDKEYSYLLPSKLGYVRERSSSFLIYGQGFGDDTPGSASAELPMSLATAPGTYRVLKAVVTDLAGNRTVYGAAELQAMGAATTIEVKGGINDTSAPVLLELSLPTSFDVMGGQVLRPVVKVQDNAGGTGVDRVIVRFEGESGLGTYTMVLPQPSPELLPQDGQPVSLANPGIYLNWLTTSGQNRIADVTVVDIAGNQTAYTRAQLDAMGVNTGIALVNGATRTASITQTLDDGVLAVDLDSTAWAASGSNSFRLVLNYDVPALDFERAALGATAGLQVTEQVQGSLGRVTITGEGLTAAQVQAGLQLTLRPAEGKLGHWWVQEFTVNGQAQGFGPGVAGGGFLQGGAGHDLADLRGYSNGGEGVVIDKTDGGFQVVTGTGYTTLLADVETVILGRERVALDDGPAAQLYRLYQAAVDRAPDAVGLGYWISQVGRGASLQEVARSFMAGAEFKTLYGADPSDDAFIGALYDNVLERAPDEAGLAWWRAAFANGLTREEALVQFSESPENLAQVAPLIANGIDYVLW